MKFSIATIIIATVWFVNGVICKLFNLVPRHQLIVARILGDDYAAVITRLIGIGELLICIWVLSRFGPRLCAIVQIVLIATMNMIEFLLAPDLLLFGRFNILLAALLIWLVYMDGLKGKYSFKY